MELTTKVNQCSDIELLKSWFTKNKDWSSCGIPRSGDDLFTEGACISTVADDASFRGRDTVGCKGDLSIFLKLQ